jgi:LacI family transcriptional regulator
LESKKELLIHDIAQHLHVSIATVSLVVNGKAKEMRISDTLAERVRQYVEEVGYQPNQLAKGLRTGKTHVIALLVEEIAHPFFATVAALIEQKALEWGYRIIYCSTHNDPAKARDLLAMFQARHVDGYILALPAGVAAEVRTLVQQGKPLVLFDRLLPDVHANAVVVDNTAGMYEATRHLLEQGYQRIALLTTQSAQLPMVARQQGYAQALREQQLPELVYEVGFPQAPEQLVHELQVFFETHPTCDAVLFATNYLGVHGLEALHHLGWRIPEQLAVVSFDDNDLFRLYSPPITVVAQPIAALAEAVVHTLLRALEGHADPTNLVQLQLAPQLVVRSSSLRAAGVSWHGG